MREWLGAMVTSQIIDVDPDSSRYRLPNERAASLSRAAGPDNPAVFAQYIPLLGTVEDEVVSCFQNGGGVPYDQFPLFHAVMEGDSSQSVLSSLDSHVLPLVQGLSNGLDRGLRVLDVGCGRGRILNRLADLFPNSEFVGMDLSNEAIRFATEDAQARKRGNVRFIERDLSAFDQWAEPEAFDFVTTFDAIHDQARPLNVLKGIHRTLNSDGIYLMQDIKGSSYVYDNIDHPLGTLLYTISCMHCMTVSLAQGGEGLGAMWGEEKTRQHLKRAGFDSVVKHERAHDIQNNWHVVRK